MAAVIIVYIDDDDNDDDDDDAYVLRSHCHFANHCGSHQRGINVTKSGSKLSKV